jgi:hypothetical protein
MSTGIVQVGDKLFVIHRVLFQGDTRRHFMGVVDACEGDLVRATGRVFSLDSRTNQFASRDRPRTRIVPLGSSEVIINVLPAKVDIERIHYLSIVGGQLRITDGTDWHLDINPT